MAEPVMKYGARKGEMNLLRRWISRVSSREIRVFPIPGADVLRIFQGPLESDSCTLAPSPRQANVLLILGEPPPPLAQKAAVAFSQIPRPRVLVFAGAEGVPILPDPDVRLPLKNDFLQPALAEIRELLANYAWSTGAEPWEPAFLQDLGDASGDDGHDHHSHQHGEKEDMDDSHDEEPDQNAEHDHEEDSDHDGHHENNNHEEQDEDGEGDGHNGNSQEEDEEGLNGNHGDMDFMSMVAMTKDLPRPADGLPMNRNDARFGPFFPGLPGGLCIHFKLDGDTVAQGRVEHGLLTPRPEEDMPLDAQLLPEKLAQLNPLSPGTYRLLARKALAALPDGHAVPFTSEELFTLEYERVASHLNWLAVFAKTVGNDALYRNAARWHALHRARPLKRKSIQPFLEQVRNMPYLKTRLRKGGEIQPSLLHHLTGPPARAAGIEQDARLNEQQYRHLSWKPAMGDDNNAWGRLLVRLEEIEQSLRLIDHTVQKQQTHATPEDGEITASGAGSAKLESPRGTLSLEVQVRQGKVMEMQLETPSEIFAGLVRSITEESELSDALVQVASLDISPWEMELKIKKGKDE